MIARIHGTLVDRHPGLVVVDVGGVGYEITIPLSTYRRLGEIGSPVELHVHTHVREDTLALFGFASRIEKDLFVRLVAVNGVGPKTAVALLSGLGAEDLMEAVRRRDVRRLATVPGIGRKTAERLLLELRDRLQSIAESRAAGAGQSAGEDALNALLALGYSVKEARAALARLDPALAAPDAIRQALKLLSKVT